MGQYRYLKVINKSLKHQASVTLIGSVNAKLDEPTQRTEITKLCKNSGGMDSAQLLCFLCSEILSNSSMEVIPWI